MRRMKADESGFTLVELLISIILIATISLSLMALFISLVNSSIVAKRQATALTLATNQMEYLKSLPYSSLNAGTTSSGVTTTSTTKVNGVTYTITTTIKYVDDAFDGCGPYITSIPLSLRPDYCRNYTASSATNDTNFNDYKASDVLVTDQGGTHLAQLDTQVAARVAEAASSNGALVIAVIDQNGNPLPGATVNITNNTVSPNINHTATTDENGLVIDYGLTPDSGKDYIITASATGYSSITTIAASGTLQPTYPNQSIITQQSSSSTLTLNQQGPNSLLMYATNASTRAPVAGLKIYVKGGYKRYATTTDTSYCYDNMRLNGTATGAACSTSTSSTDNRPLTDAGGLAALSNLVPGPYVFCGDVGDTGCGVGGTSYYLAAAVPYGGNTVFNPVSVPTYNAASPPPTTYNYAGNGYYQEVQLLLTTSASFPRVNSISPSDISLSGGNATAFPFVVNGVNLTGATVKFVQGGNNFPATCSGTSDTQLSCSIDISTAVVGSTQLVINNASGTLTIPNTLNLGGLIVRP